MREERRENTEGLEQAVLFLHACRARISCVSAERLWDQGYSSPHTGLPWCLSGKESACQCRRRGFKLWVRKIPWRRAWQPTPVFLPGKSQGQRSLEGYSPRGCKESDVTQGYTLPPPRVSAWHMKDPESIQGSAQHGPELASIQDSRFSKFKRIKGTKRRFPWVKGGKGIRWVGAEEGGWNHMTYCDKGPSFR